MIEVECIDKICETVVSKIWHSRFMNLIGDMTLMHVLPHSIICNILNNYVI